MNFEKLTKLDDIFGEFLCRGVLQLGSPGRDAVIRTNPRVLVAKLRSIGDVVLSLPMVRALKAQGAEVFFLSGDVNRQWLTLQPYLDRVIGVNLNTLWKPPRLFRLLREIRREHIDVYIDLTQSSHFASLICHGSNAPMRIGFEILNPKKRFKNRMYTHLIPFNNGQHVIRNYFELLGPLGVPAPQTISLPALHCGAADEKYIDAVMADANPDGRELVGVHLSGTIPAKRWPLNRWAETIAGLLSANRRVIAVGSRDESSRIEAVRAKLGGKGAAMVNSAGRFTLPQLFALMKRFRFFLANDGGPMHIAAAMGIPTLGLFGPETPLRYAPYNRNCLSLYKGDGLDCSPCSRPYDGSWPTCRRPLCLERISSADVLQALDRLLLGDGPAPLRP